MGRRLPANRNHGSPDPNGVVRQTEVKMMPMFSED